MMPHKETNKTGRWEVPLLILLITVFVFYNFDILFYYFNASLSTSAPKTTKPLETSNGEYFASIIRMRQLALTEQLIVQKMTKHVSVTLENSKNKLIRKSIKIINRYVSDYDNSIRPMLLKLHVNPAIYFRYPLTLKSPSDLETLQTLVISHPLVSFRTIRRVFRDLPIVLKAMKIKMKDLISPPLDLGDLTGATEGILRIQKTFNISTEDLTQGKLMTYKTNSGLKGVDAYLIGRHLLEDETQPIYLAVEWLLWAFKLVKTDHSVGYRQVRNVLQKAAIKHNELWPNENTFVEKVTDFDATYTRAPETISNCDADNFEALCRGSKSLAPRTSTRPLRCYYKRDSPYLRIKPLKVEMHNRKHPLILQIYDILPPSVIAHAKSLAQTKLRRAEVLSEVSNTAISKIRISSNAWLYGGNDPILQKIPKLIKEATGLNAVPGISAEESQISAYGSIGGYYKFHHDILFNPKYQQYKTLSTYDIFQGDRIATVMFYLSDTLLGGGTAFPRLGVVSKAVEGSAMFWYNLYKNTTRNDITLHGGCPVLYGEKWVLNKWIRSGSQMFIRKCSTNRLQ